MKQYIKDMYNRITNKPKQSGGFLINGKYCYTQEDINNAIEGIRNEYKQLPHINQCNDYSQQLKSKQEIRNKSTYNPK
jgi:vesicle coat complex subunit